MRGRLIDELEIMGFSVESERDHHGAVPAARTREGVEAVVLARRSGENQLWVRHRDGGPRSAPQGEGQVPHESAPGDGTQIDGAGLSPDLLALRTAEYLRGELLPESRGEQPVSPYAPTQSDISTRWSATAGYGLLDSDDGGAGSAVTADASYWFQRFGLGLFVLADLHRQAWKKTPKDFETRQSSLGAQLRYRILGRSRGLQVQGLARLGLRGVTVSTTTGSEKDQFSGTELALVAAGGVEISHAPLPWLTIGGQVVGQLGIPVASPRVPDDLPKGKKDPLTTWVESSPPDGTFVAMAVVGFRF